MPGAKTADLEDPDKSSGGQRSERAQPRHAASRKDEGGGGGLSCYIFGLRPPHSLRRSAPVGRVQEKLTTLNILRLSLSLSRHALALLPPKLLPTTQDYSLAQRGRGRKAHRSGAGTRECALGLKDDVAAGSSGRRAATAALPRYP